MKKSLEGFVRWTKLKIRIHLSEPKIYFKEREIWWASLGVNIGFEQDGKNETFERPILILKIFNLDVLWILPLTSKNKTGKYYFQIEHNNKKYSIILSQLRLVSSKRLLRKIRKISPEEFVKIKEKIKCLI
ncbi:MAG: type II toxin-antitoxin system PemK/MazF family toxin [Candidatus Magasanikbacteria bacterium]